MSCLEGARKRGALRLRRWFGLVPRSDGGEGSSSSAERARALALPPPKQEPVDSDDEEPTTEDAVVAAGEEEDLSQLDFVGDDELDRVTAQVLRQSAREAEAAAEERRRKEELDKLLLQKGVAAEHEHRHRAEEWKRIVEEQALLYVDLDTSSDED